MTAKRLLSVNWSGWGIDIQSEVYRYNPDAVDDGSSDNISVQTKQLLDFAADHVERPHHFSNDSEGILMTEVMIEDPEHAPSDVDLKIRKRITFVNNRNRFIVLYLMMTELVTRRPFIYIQRQEEAYQIFWSRVTPKRLIAFDPAMGMLLDAFGGSWACIGQLIGRTGGFK